MDDSRTPAKSIERSVVAETPNIARENDIIAGGLDSTLNFAEQELARVDSLPKGTPEHTKAVIDAEKALHHAAKIINLRSQIEAKKTNLSESVSARKAKREQNRQLKEHLNLPSTPESSYSVNVLSNESPRPRLTPPPTEMKPRRVDPALIGKSLSEHSSDAETGDNSMLSSADLSAAAKRDEARARAAGVDNAMYSGSSEMSPDEIDSSVQKIINDVSESIPSADSSESSGSFSTESSKSHSVADDSVPSSEHESFDVADVKMGKVTKRTSKKTGKVRYYKKLQTLQERNDMMKFYDDHRFTNLIPTFLKLVKSDDAPYGTFVTEGLDEQYVPLRSIIGKGTFQSENERKALRLAFHDAFKRVKGKWNDLVNADNILVKRDDNGSFNIRFVEGGRFDPIGYAGTADERALEYQKEFYMRERKGLPDEWFKRFYGSFL